MILFLTIKTRRIAFSMQFCGFQLLVVQKSIFFKLFDNVKKTNTLVRGVFNSVSTIHEQIYLPLELTATI